MSKVHQEQSKAKSARIVQPEEVVVALHRFFANFLQAIELEWAKRGLRSELRSAQLLFTPGGGFKCLLDDEVAVRISYSNGESTGLVSGDDLFLARVAGEIAAVSADVACLGHITVVLGEARQPLGKGGIWLPRPPLRARAIVAWDLRRVVLAAMVDPRSAPGRAIGRLLRQTWGREGLAAKAGAQFAKLAESALAEALLEKTYEGRANALLPLEFLFVEGQGLARWDQWLGEKRPAAEVITEEVRKKLDAEIHGTGVESRRAKRSVIVESAFAARESDEDDRPAMSLDVLPFPEEASDDYSCVETLADLDRARKGLPPVEAEAMDIAIAAMASGSTFKEECLRRGVKPEPMRKAKQRASDKLRPYLLVS